ncbi:MAG: transcriptional regulator [Betaproteobacteria bacterium]|nr:MAG: transcriptional regulator [Betaproteobacteria bacterium]
MSISRALFTDSQARVYRCLFGQPEREFHLNELRRLTGLGSASLQRELNRLADAGLVTSERVGNLRRFRANPSSPVYMELIALTRKVLGAEPLLRDALAVLTFNLKGAWIYGSYAKESETAQSDLDVMLVGNRLTLSRVLEVLAPLEEELGRKINPTLYTTAEFAKRRAEPDSFVNRVLAQPVLALMGNLHESPRPR